MTTTTDRDPFATEERAPTTRPIRALVHLTTLAGGGPDSDPVLLASLWVPGANSYTDPRYSSLMRIDGYGLCGKVTNDDLEQVAYAQVPDDIVAMVLDRTVRSTVIEVAI